MFGKSKKARKPRRYAILSDVHSNIHALEKVLEDARNLNADEIIVAGDLVGYGAYPNEVIERLRMENAICISGNHDRGVTSGDLSFFNDIAAMAVRWTVNHISEDNWKYLEHLDPHKELAAIGLFPGLESVGLYHGSPFDDDEYIWPNEASDILLFASGNQLVITGHTHLPFVEYLPHGLWLNPGSVGQPRDLDWRASYILYDERERSAQLRRIVYPAKDAAQAIIAAGLPRTLGVRLLYGR